MATRTATRKRPAAEEPRPTPLRRPAIEEEDQAAVTDDEVEEFFTILQRMREARLFAARAGRGGMAKAAERPCPASRWRPAFEQEDFEEAAASSAAAEDSGRRRTRSTSSAPTDAVAEDGSRGRFLDLNTEPATEE